MPQLTQAVYQVRLDVLRGDADEGSRLLRRFFVIAKRIVSEILIDDDTILARSPPHETKVNVPFFAYTTPCIRKIASSNASSEEPISTRKRSPGSTCSMHIFGTSISDASAERMRVTPSWTHFTETTSNSGKRSRGIAVSLLSKIRVKSDSRQVRGGQNRESTHKA